MALPLCVGAETPGQKSNGPGQHDICCVCAGNYRVKLDGTLVKHRPHHRPGSPADAPITVEHRENRGRIDPDSLLSLE